MLSNYFNLQSVYFEFDMEINFQIHSNANFAYTEKNKLTCALGLILKVSVFGSRKWPINATTRF